MHDEFTEKEKPQRLVPLLGLDGKTISSGSYRRGGGISLDIPFYRTGLSECGNLRAQPKLRLIVPAPANAVDADNVDLRECP